MAVKKSKPRERAAKGRAKECDVCYRKDCPTPIDTLAEQDASKRFCEADGCHEHQDTGDMIRIGDDWFCPDHAAELNRLCVVVGHIIVDASVSVEHLADELFDELERFEGVLESLGVLIHSVKEPELTSFMFGTREHERLPLYANRARELPRWRRNPETES